MSLAKAEAAPRTPLLGIALLASLALCWGLAWPASKIVLDEMPVLAFRLLCMAVGGPVALALARLGGETIRLPRREILPIAVVALLNVTIWQLAMAYGLRLMPAGHASIIAYTMPAFATLFGRIFLRERLSRARLLSLALSMSGIAVLVAPDLEAFLAAPLGVLLLLLAAASWAGGTVGMKYFDWSISALQSTGWQFLVGGAPIVVAALAAGSVPHLSELSARGLTALVYMLVFPILYAQWAWFRAVALLPGSVSAMGTLAIPVVGTLSGALLLGEPLDPSELVALALVVAALALVALSPPVKD